MADNLFNDHVRVTRILEHLLHDNIDTARNEIFQFLELLGKKEAESIVPRYDSTLDVTLSRTILTILLKYAECLSRSKNIEDVREVMLVIEKIDPWLMALDSDMVGRTELVIHLLEPTSYAAADDLAAERIAVTLLEHNKVCKDDPTMLQLGKALVSREELWEELEFLRKVLGHLDRKCQVVDARELTWATCLMKLQTYDGSLHPNIRLTMQSVILNLHLEDALCDKGSDLLEPMNLIAKARASRVQGLDDCVEYLDDAINLLKNWKGNTNEHGSHDFLLGQALCLRALSHYELLNSTKNFSKDIGEALKWLTSSDYIHLADKYQCLSLYTTKLLYYVLDVIITEHNGEGFLKKIVSLFEQSGEMRMLWQFKSHHNHLNSDYQVQTNTIDRDFAKDYNFVVEEGESIETLERMVSNIVSKVPLSQKSRCRLAQLYYDLAERMLLMGSMTKALEYARQEDKDKSAFDIPKEMLIATLKHALILSRETPELIKKVAQLLAIMYMLKYDEEETPKSENSLTHWQWACFFHQLTVGSGVNYLFSLRLSKVYGDSDADKILHRLTPRSGVDDLSDFVKEFYNELEPRTIVVMNVLGPKYKKFMPMFLPFLETSECVAILMISRFGSTCQPLYKLFTVNSSGPAVLGPDEEPWIAPWGTNTIVDRMLPDFKMLIKHYHNWSLHITHDGRLSKLISHMESWLGPNKNILLGEILEGQKNQKLDNFGRFTGEGVNDSKTAPVILVLDKDIHMLPWESMKILENQEIYRMPSVSSIFYAYEKCHKSGRKTVKDFASDATLDPSNAYYVIDPEIENIDEWKLAVSLNNEFHLEGIFWKDVVVEEILEILKSRSLFIYCGHNAGLQYISRNALKTLEVSASAILMGCASGLLKSEGPYTPLGAPIDYLLAGSPIVMCNLWNIHQHWALELTETLLQTFKEKMKGGLTRTLLRTFEERMEDEVGIVACLDLARNNSPDLMSRAITICYGVPTLLQKRMP
ncbi:separase isoform X1 [Tanacetum coccineum]|uniref:separase n=1 Tax=Tanacetum coccineum TaxID=301880 RepID=A0ABQ5GE95_9ASTR